MTHTVRWQVSLNNGETCQEGRGAFEDIEGEASPWQKLQAYIDANGLRITALSLRTSDGRTFNLPSAGNNPRFAIVDIAEKPVKFAMFRALGQDVQNNKDVVSEDLFTVIEAQYEKGLKSQIWVDE